MSVILNIVEPSDLLWNKFGSDFSIHATHAPYDSINR
jgi:hypothetical protein